MGQISYGTITITDTTDIDSIQNWYLATSASSGVTKETSEWTLAIQQMTIDKQYLWNYEQILGTGGIEISSTQPVIIGHYGKDGAEGNSITSIDEYYKITNSTSNPGSSNWSVNTLVVPTSTNKYLWNYQVIHYSKTADEGSYNDARIIGVYGDKGERGTSILKVTTQPTTTSGTAGGFSYSYRMSRSTVINESGKTEVLKGDIIEYGSNHYQVGYVSSSYVYLGPITSIKGADGIQYYTHIYYSSKQTPTSASDVSSSPSGKTFVGIQTTTSSTAPAWNDSNWNWTKYIGTDGVSVTAVKEIYYLTTGSAPTAPAAGVNTTSTSTSTNIWTTVVPTYVPNGKYYTSIQTTLSEGISPISSAAVLNNALNSANSNAAEALAQASAAQNATALLGGHFIYKSTASTSGLTPPSANVVQTITVGSTDVTQDPTQWGHNVHIGSNGIKLRYNEIDRSVWTEDKLIFYEPKIVNNSYTQGNKALEIGADGLKLFKHHPNVENSPSVAATLTTEGLAITDGFINLNDGKFIVNSDGQANMQDILIKGEITGQMIADSIAVTDYGSNIIKGSTTEFKSYELSTDTVVNSNKTYYTRSISDDSYIYTEVSNPSPSVNPSTEGYYEDVVYMAKDLYMSSYNSDPIQRIEAGIEITQDGIYFTQKYSDLPNSKIIIGLIAGAGDAKKPSTDVSVNSQKTYYTRKGSGDSYIYTEVSNPSGNPSTNEYYETIPLSEEFIIENLKPKRIIFGELEMFEYNNGLAIRRKN